MNQQNQFTKRLKSFGFALKGIGFMLRTQMNAKIHAVAALVVITLGFIYSIETFEWCLIIFAIGLVFIAELFNTALEFLTDLISPHYHEKAGKVKDIAAGAVLFAAITAALIGLMIFIPRIFY
jgi:diacylglycerol kinase (ATP)